MAEMTLEDFSMFAILAFLVVMTIGIGLQQWMEWRKEQKALGGCSAKVRADELCEGGVGAMSEVMKEGQRVEVRLYGEDILWFPGVVVDPATKLVKLDNKSTIADKLNIREWRAAP